MSRTPDGINEGFRAGLAGGVVDTAVGVPKSREEMFEFYSFIRRGTLDAEIGRAHV